MHAGYKESSALACACTACIEYRHNEKRKSYTYSNIKIECPQLAWRDLQMNRTPSLKNSASIKDVSAGVGQHSSLHLFLCLCRPSLFFTRDFFSPNKIQSERILEANIHCFVRRLVKEKKDDECVYACVWTSIAYTVALCWQLMQS